MKNVMFVINLMKLITELNQLNIKLGYFLAKNVENLSQSKRNIHTEEQESLKWIYLQIALYANLKNI